VNVGVEPTVAPEEDSIFTLCASGAMFVKSTVTLPAFALSDLVLYSSWPSLLASRLTVLAPAAAPVVDVAELVVGAAAVAELVVGACAAELDDELELELPQPARAATVATSANDEIADATRLVAFAAACCLTSPPSIGVVAVTTPPGPHSSRAGETG
jgi:hypothetical protein